MIEKVCGTSSGDGGDFGDLPLTAKGVGLGERGFRQLIKDTNNLAVFLRRNVVQGQRTERGTFSACDAGGGRAADGPFADAFLCRPMCGGAATHRAQRGQEPARAQGLAAHYQALAPHLYSV